MPLILAVRKGKRKAVISAIEQGASCDCFDEWGLTPLHWAAWHGHSTIVKTLLEHGADVMAIDHYDHRPIHLASIRSYIDVVMILKNAENPGGGKRQKSGFNLSGLFDLHSIGRLS